MSNEFTKVSDMHWKYTDQDGDILDVYRTESPSHGEDITVSAFDGACVNARELINAIIEVAGLDLYIFDRSVYRSVHGVDPEGHETPVMEGAFAEPEPLWVEVRERPDRAVKVTESLVRALSSPGCPAELWGLQPRFSPHNGNPAGVTFENAVGEAEYAHMGDVVVLRHGKCPISMGADKFEQAYMEVAA